ncbi:MAG: BsuPI-related putative proteinase inhibitor [Halanaerobiales bacterium]
MKMKTLFLILLMIFLFIGTAVFGVEAGAIMELSAAEETGGVDNNMEVKFLRPGIEVIDDIELVCLRDLADKLDWSLRYIPGSKEIIIRSNGEEIPISLKKGTAAGEKMAELPVIKEGRTFISVDTVKTIIGRSGKEYDKILIVGLAADKEEYSRDEEIIARIRAINIGEETIYLDFGSGQKYDLYLEDDGEEIWRWSEGRFFTMALDRIELKPGERLDYDVEVMEEEEPEPGNYTLYGELSTVESPVQLNSVKLIIK